MDRSQLSLSFEWQGQEFGPGFQTVYGPPPTPEAYRGSNIFGPRTWRGARDRYQQLGREFAGVELVEEIEGEAGRRLAARLASLESWGLTAPVLVRRVGGRHTLVAFTGALLPPHDDLESFLPTEGNEVYLVERPWHYGGSPASVVLAPNLVVAQFQIDSIDAGRPVDTLHPQLAGTGYGRENQKLRDELAALLGE